LPALHRGHGIGASEMPTALTRRRTAQVAYRPTRQRGGQPGPWPDAPRCRTRRKIIALRRGLAVYRGQGTAKPLTAEERAGRATELPPPTFDAGPRLRELDELERGGG
jgi:hypothetical protein